MPPLGPTIAQLLEALPPPARMTFFALAEAMYKVRFTGPTTVHWRNGLPMQVDSRLPGQALDRSRA